MVVDLGGKSPRHLLPESEQPVIETESKPYWNAKAVPKLLPTQARMREKSKKGLIKVSVSKGVVGLCVLCVFLVAFAVNYRK
jgi:hypothetical protein